MHGKCHRSHFGRRKKNSLETNLEAVLSPKVILTKGSFMFDFCCCHPGLSRDARFYFSGEISVLKWWVGSIRCATLISFPESIVSVICL